MSPDDAKWAEYGRLMFALAQDFCAWDEDSYAYAFEYAYRCGILERPKYEPEKPRMIAGYVDPELRGSGEPES